MDQEHRIVIAATPNSAYRSYHVNWLISHSPIEDFPLPLPSYKRKDLAKCGPVASELISRLSEFDGVSRIFLKPYEGSVIRGEAFKWSEVEPKVIAAFIATLPEEDQTSVVVAYQEGQVPEDQDDLGLAGDLVSYRSFVSQ